MVGYSQSTSVFKVKCRHCGKSKSKHRKTHGSGNTRESICNDCRSERCVSCGSKNIKTALVRSKGRCKDCGDTWDTSEEMSVTAPTSSGSSDSHAECDDCGAPLDKPGGFCKSCAKRNRRDRLK